MSTMKSLKVIGIGEVVWDCLPEGKKLGGAPVNFSYFCKELGADAYPVTAIGSDQLADETMTELKLTGLDLSLISRNELPTSRVLVELNEEGVPQYTIVENVAWDAMEATPAALKLMADADVVCWGSLAQRTPKSRDAVLALVDAVPDTALKVFDINIRKPFFDKETIVASLEKANVLKLNEDELPLLIDMLSLPAGNDEAIAALIKQYSLKYLLFTQGAVCSGIYDASGEISTLPTPKVKVADTVGAGDSFTAAFVTSLLKGASVTEAHRKAVDVAAYVCTQSGVIHPIPDNLR